MKLRKLSKPVSAILATIMACGNLVVAGATDDALISETPLEDAENTEYTGTETNYNEVEVTYNQASRYSVSIPKTIALNTSKQASYAIKVTGDIDANESVYVSPVDAIASTDDIDFYMKDENSLKPDVVATVNQNKFYWSSTEVADGYEATNNSISAPNLTSGSWKGTFQVEIHLETSHEHDYSNGKCSICGRIDPSHIHTYENGVCTECGEKESGVSELTEAGLYDANGRLLYRWEELGIDSTCSNAKDFINKLPVKVIIPDSVTSIDGLAFANCSSLIDVTIPDSVTHIGGLAFSECTSLTNLIIPDSVTHIGTNAFHKVPHITYNGTATGSPWGALTIN